MRTDTRICCQCGSHGHIRIDCPTLRRNEELTEAEHARRDLIALEAHAQAELVRHKAEITRLQADNSRLRGLLQYGDDVTGVQLELFVELRDAAAAVAAGGSMEQLRRVLKKLPQHRRPDGD